MSTTTEAAPKKKLSPRRRAQRIRWIQYALLVVVAVAIALAADWEQIKEVFFRPDMIKATFTEGLPNAFKNTLVYTAGAFVIGLLPLAFEGLVIPYDPYGTVWVALGLVASAYMAETIRAGIQAVPKGQIEAARSLGMPAGAATRKIILPQAFRVVTPPLTNEVILLVKDSSLVYVLGLSASGYELTKYGRDLANSNANLTPLVIAGFCYLAITLPLSILVRRMEARQKKER